MPIGFCQFGFPSGGTALFNASSALFEAFVESQVLFLQLLLMTRSRLAGLGFEPAFEFEFLATQLFLRLRLCIP